MSMRRISGVLPALILVAAWAAGALIALDAPPSVDPADPGAQFDRLLRGPGVFPPVDSVPVEDWLDPSFACPLPAPGPGE